MYISDIFCNFVGYKRGGSDCIVNPYYSPFKTHTAMNKTMKIVLQALGYIISLLLGAAGGASML